MKSNKVLNHLQGRQQALENAFGAQDALLRRISNQLDILLDRLATQPIGGATVQQQPAEAARPFADNVVPLWRTDRQTASTAHLPPDRSIRARAAEPFATEAKLDPDPDDDTDRLLQMMEQAILGRPQTPSDGD